MVFKSFHDMGVYLGRPVKVRVHAPVDVMNLWVDLGEFNGNEVVVYRNKRRSKINPYPCQWLWEKASPVPSGKGRSLIRMPITRHFVEVVRYDRAA